MFLSGEARYASILKRKFTFAVSWLFETIATEEDVNYFAKERDRKQLILLLQRFFTFFFTPRTKSSSALEKRVNVTPQKFYLFR